MKKSTSIAIVALLVSATGVAHAETLRAITVEQNASYALDSDSLVQSNGKTAFSVQTVYTSKMKAPNGSEYTKATNTFLADCKAKTQALTGVSLMDGSGKVVYSYNPTVTEAPMISPEKNSLDAKIMQTACTLK
ncbi:MAG: hypothetical protein RL651_1324 [Pseudomonadota bacterium]|jgi:hypothetical protein